MDRIALLLLLALGFSACNDLDTVQIKDAEDNLLVEYTRRKSNLARQGDFRAFNEQGVLVEEAQYDNDTLHGSRKLFFETGELMIEENHVHGEFQGWYRTYYKNGQINLEGKYVDNSMDGEWKRYYENGQLMEKVLFSANQENGPFVEYHENGQLKAEGQYLEGDKEHGELKLYDEAGELERIMNCDRGICRTTWTKTDGPLPANN